MAAAVIDLISDSEDESPNLRSTGVSDVIDLDSPCSVHVTNKQSTSNDRGAAGVQYGRHHMQLLSPSVDCIPETPSPAAAHFAHTAHGALSSSAHQPEPARRLAAVAARRAEKMAKAAESTSEESEIEDLTVPSVPVRSKCVHFPPTYDDRRNVRSCFTNNGLSPARGSPCTTLQHSPRVSASASNSLIAVPGPPMQRAYASTRQPSLQGQGHNGHERQGQPSVSLVHSGGGNLTEQGLTKPAEKEAAKKRKAEERQAARQHKAAMAEAAKRRRAEEREQAKVEKNVAKAALKVQKEHDKEKKRKTGGKRALENVFITVDDRAAGDTTDAAMQSMLVALEEAFPGQTQMLRQRVAGAITFQRVVFVNDSDDADGADMADFAMSPAKGSAGACVCREETAPQVLFYMPPSRLVDLVSQHALAEWAQAAVGHFPPHCAPLLLVVALDKHLRSLSAARSKALSAQVGLATSELLVKFRMGFRSVHSIDEASLVLTRMTRAIAEEPYRSPPSVVQLYRDAKASAGRSHSYSSGVEAFYHTIPGIGESCAKVIAQAYPSLRALARKYKDVAANCCDGQGSRESVRLLENLVYQGSSTSSRKSQRLGPKRSERIHLLFHSRDPMCAISTLCFDAASAAPSI